MANFHVCHPGHDCSRRPTSETLFEVGTKVVFAVNQFKESVAESLTVRVIQGA